MYDSKLGCFLSPDNYIQEPFNTQNFNRYGYVLNNPLKFTDQSGEFLGLALIFIAAFAVGNTVAHAIRGDINSFWDGLGYFFQGALAGAGLFALSGVPILGSIMLTSASFNFVSSAINTVVSARYGIVTGDWSRFRNSGKQFLGNFYLDENKSFFEGALEGVSRFSWQAPQNAAGSVYTNYRNVAGKVDRVDYLGGATFSTNENDGKNYGVSIGNFININTKNKITENFDDYVIKNPLYMHEYGHYVQSQDFGLSYLFAVGVPSIISAGKKNGDHKNFWTETKANKYASKYFGRHFGVNWAKYKNRF